jgi:hypothetical protein
LTTAKEALLAAGRIQAITRGRISLDNHAWLKAQHDAGVRFSDWPKGEVVVNVDKPAEVRVVRDPKLNGEKVIAEFTIIYPRDDYKAVAGNKVYGMAEVCNNCRVSLVQCHCDSPTILGDIPVKIVHR